MRSRGLRSPRVFLYVGAQVASTLNPNAWPSVPQPKQQDIKNQTVEVVEEKNGKVCTHVRMCAVGRKNPILCFDSGSFCQHF